MNILKSKEFKNAWSQLFYGKDATPERILNRITLKVGLGYHIGSGSTFLLNEIGFMVDGKLTKKGEDYLFKIIEPQTENK